MAPSSTGLLLLLLLGPKHSSLQPLTKQIEANTSSIRAPTFALDSAGKKKRLRLYFIVVLLDINKNRQVHPVMNHFLFWHLGKMWRIILDNICFFLSQCNAVSGLMIIFTKYCDCIAIISNINILNNFHF